MKIVVAEDEKLLREVLVSQLSEFEFVEEIISCSSVKDLKEIVENDSFDLLILDLQLRDGISMDFIESIGPFEFELIITSSYSEYGVRAVNLGTKNYFLKPISFEELASAIEEVNSNLSVTKISSGKLKRIAIRSINTIEMVNIDDIMYLHSDGSYTTLHLIEGTITTSKSIKFFDSMLAKSGFFRIHQSYLANMAKVAKYHLGGTIVLTDGKELTVSRRRRDQIIEMLQ